MHSKTISKTLMFTMLVIAIVSLILSSCMVDIPGITGITPTPITPSPTPRVCPSDISLGELGDFILHPTFIVVLFDSNSTNGNDVLEYVNRKKTADIMGFVGDLLPKVLGPGDQYSLFSLGFRGYETAKLGRYNSRITEAPVLVPTPIYPATLTPIPTPTLSNVVLDNQKAKNEHELAVTAQYATATQQVFEYNCEVLVYENMYQATATQWSVTKQAEAVGIATQVQEARANKQNALQVIETPFASDNVYEGLAHVTIDFENQCKYYERCILIIFDDLIDWRNTRPEDVIPENLHINLSRVEIIEVMPQCADIIQPSCTYIQNLWTDKLKSLGATKVIPRNGERLEQFLIDYLGGKNE